MSIDSNRLFYYCFRKMINCANCFSSHHICSKQIHFFFQSYYSLIVRGHLQPGESILVHAGFETISMSAISIALSLNCEVFTTVKTTENIKILKTMFPQLKDSNIGEYFPFCQHYIFISLFYNHRGFK